MPYGALHFSVSARRSPYGGLRFCRGARRLAYGHPIFFLRFVGRLAGIWRNWQGRQARQLQVLGR